MKTPKRPRDPSQLAKMLVDIASGDAPKDSPKSRRAEGGRVGGPARAASLPAEERRKIAKNAAATRWKNKAASE